MEWGGRRIQGQDAERAEVGQGPSYELESCEGAVGAWGAAWVRKGVQWPAAAESSPREKGLRGCSEARSRWEGRQCVRDAGRGAPTAPPAPFQGLIGALKNKCTNKLDFKGIRG